jgi:acetyl-CoA carboxylase biotin carboxyl carrier protein
MAEEKQGIDQDLIRQLAVLLKETDLTDIEVEQGDFRVRVSRKLRTAVHAVQSEAQASHPGSAAPLLSPSPAAVADPLRHPGCVPSPMVGTVYRASAPGTRAFVEVGDSVRVGQTILIIEAMKHMNEVASPLAGRVTSILVEDNQPVEFGEPLMIIE